MYSELSGSNPGAWWKKPVTTKVPGLFIQMVPPAGCLRIRFANPHPLRRFAPCGLRWKTLRVSSAPHPAGFESLMRGTPKRKSPIAEALYYSNGAPSGIRTRGIHLERVAS